MYSKVEKFVFDSFKAIGKSDEMPHFTRTVYWLKVLVPNADEALCVAAIAHDIERAFRQNDTIQKKLSAGFLDPEFLRLHEERGAEIIADFLETLPADKQFIERVKMLVSRHEEGGNDDQNVLKDADSISFFEMNTASFLEHASREVGMEMVRKKFDWMYSRITSDTARKIAEPLYGDAIRALDAWRA